MNKIRAAGVGELIWDVFGDSKHIGGAPANFALSIKNSGNEAFILSRVGLDKDGDEILRELKDRGIDISFIQRDESKATGRCNVALNGSDPSFDLVEDVAYDYIEYSKEWMDIIDTADVVSFGTVIQRTYSAHIALNSLLKGAIRPLKIFDVNLRQINENSINILAETLFFSDILKLNEKEFEFLRREYKNYEDEDILFARKLILEFDLKLVAITFGERGALLVSKNDYAYHKGYKVNAIDTTGAGDAFTAGLAIKYLENYSSLKDIVEFANKIAAYVCTKRGAAPLWVHADIDKIK